MIAITFDISRESMEGLPFPDELAGLTLTVFTRSVATYRDAADSAAILSVDHTQTIDDVMNDLHFRRPAGVVVCEVSPYLKTDQTILVNVGAFPSGDSPPKDLFGVLLDEGEQFARRAIRTPRE